MTLRIAIAGAGIGGLTAALALLRAGFDVAVYEAASRIDLLGAGISLPPNAWRVLERLGLAQALLQVGCQPERGLIRNGLTAEIIKEVPFGAAVQTRFGAPYVQLHRADLQSVLLQALLSQKPDAVKLGHSLCDATTGPEGARLTFENGYATRADVLVGADGVRSTVRERLLGAQPARFTGVVAWRGTVSLDRVPPTSQSADSTVWILPDHQIVHYPISSGAALNVAALKAGCTWQAESWTERSTLSELLGAFQDFNAQPLGVLESLDPGTCFKWGLFDRDPLPTWRKGALTLLGDAAHPMLPHLAQGAAQAIEDAWVLAAALHAQPGDPQAALGVYEAARRPRTDWVQLEARAAGERLSQRSPAPGAAPSFKGDEALREDTLFRFDPDAALRFSPSAG
jgi:salicylate hydroxylase